MRLIFLGTPEFAVPTLEAAAGAGHEVLAVFTQPDRPKGRGRETALSPVKKAALRLGLPVHQPERIRRPEVVEMLKAMKAEAQQQGASHRGDGRGRHHPGPQQQAHGGFESLIAVFVRDEGHRAQSLPVRLE
jgi:hypothetical protein